jgi:hypothetical protein
VVVAGAPAILTAYSPYCHGTTVKQGPEPAAVALSLTTSGVQAVVAVVLRPV